MNLKNAAALTLLIMACIVSLVVLGFSCYKLTQSNNNLYISLLSSILGMWMGVAMSYIKLITGADSEVSAV